PARLILQTIRATASDEACADSKCSENALPWAARQQYADESNRGFCSTPQSTQGLVEGNAAVNRLSHLRWLLCSVCMLLCWAACGWAENWPHWRGPENNGISKATQLPAEWSEKKNILWKVPLPGLAGSTPILWDARLFLTSSEGRNLILLCLNT